MEQDTHSSLARRERQIMDVVYRLSEASAADVQANLPDPPSYSAVRAHLAVLEGKGYVRHTRVGRRYIYLPVVPRDKAKRSVLRNVLDTFFAGSVEKAVAALLDEKASELSDADYANLTRLIEEARKEGR